MEEDLWALEERLWLGDALFYEQHLAVDARMVFPQPVGMMGRAQILASIEPDKRWRRVEFANQHLLAPAEGTAVLVYAAAADRGSTGSAYRAQCSSVYVRTGGRWQLVAHHQTPADCKLSS
ncbi:nuclear transport factor 2 family protein [Variovorax sp. LjRoot290]|uniref:nuclear transport factor 2 family protein n=1 Tax=unclassified Variovorax TaxID=663243 RepID=UPI003ECD5396